VKSSSDATSQVTGYGTAGMPPSPASGAGASRVHRITLSGSGSPEAIPRVKGSPGISGRSSPVVGAPLVPLVPFIPVVPVSPPDVPSLSLSPPPGEPQPLAWLAAAAARACSRNCLRFNRGIRSDVLIGGREYIDPRAI
jgi:hypothetical protein